MSTFSQFTGGGGIKSIQRGTITFSGMATTATATISSVDTSKSELRALGETCSASTALTEVFNRIALTNSTTITATRATAANSITTIVSWELTEWN